MLNFINCLLLFKSKVLLLKEDQLSISLIEFYQMFIIITEPAQPGLMMVKERDSTFLVVQWAAPPGVVKNYKVEATVGTVSTAISPSTERRIYDITTPGAEVTVTVTAISGEDALDKDLMGEPRIEKFKTSKFTSISVLSFLKCQYSLKDNSTMNKT